MNRRRFDDEDLNHPPQCFSQNGLALELYFVYIEKDPLTRRIRCLKEITFRIHDFGGPGSLNYYQLNYN